MAEGMTGVRPVEADVVTAEHEADTVAERKPEREVEFQVALLAGCAPNSARIEDAGAVERPAAQEQLVEAAELVGGRDHTGGRHDATEEARII